MKNKGIILAENLKKLRKSSGYSMAELAEKLGLSSHGVYANWEYGRNEPNISTLIAIAELYKISVDELIGHRNDKEEVTGRNVHKQVIDLVEKLTVEDVKLIKEIIVKFRGYSFSKHLG